MAASSSASTAAILLQQQQAAAAAQGEVVVSPEVLPPPRANEAVRVNIEVREGRATHPHTLTHWLADCCLELLLPFL